MKKNDPGVKVGAARQVVMEEGRKIRGVEWSLGITFGIMKDLVGGQVYGSRRRRKAVYSDISRGFTTRSGKNVIPHIFARASSAVFQTILCNSFMEEGSDNSSFFSEAIS